MTSLIEYRPQRFFSKQDRGSIRHLEEIFSRQGIFFIEKIETQQWIEEHTPMGPVMTSDPHKAIQFKTLGEAMTWRIKNNYLECHGWKTTEHEFI